MPSGLSEQQRSDILARLAAERAARRSRVLGPTSPAASPDDEAAGAGVWGPESVLSAWREEERYAAGQPERVEPALVTQASHHLNSIHVDNAIHNIDNNKNTQCSNGSANSSRGDGGVRGPDSAAVVTTNGEQRNSSMRSGLGDSDAGTSWRRTPSAPMRQGGGGLLTPPSSTGSSRPPSPGASRGILEAGLSAPCPSPHHCSPEEAAPTKTSPPIPEDEAVEYFPEDKTLHRDDNVDFTNINPPSGQRWEQCSPAPAFSLTPGSGGKVSGERRDQACGTTIARKKSVQVPATRPARPASAPRERQPPAGAAAPAAAAAAMKARGKDARHAVGNRHGREAVIRKVSEQAGPEPRAQGRAAAGRERAHSAARLDRLAAPRSHDKWVAERQKAQQRELEECSFKPATGRGPYSNGMASDLAASERLYLQYETKQDQRQKLKLELEEAELKQCSFQPQINRSYVHRSHYRPLHDRLAELQRRRSDNLTRARLAAETCNPDLTFAPKVNETSRRIVEVLAERGVSPLPSRLTQHSHQQTEGKMRRQEQLAEAMHEECTFQPQINHTTEKMIEVMDACGRNQDFLQRQQDYIDLQTHRRQLKARDADSECTFKPDIGRSELVVSRSRHSVVVYESVQERVERLAFKDKVRMEGKKENLTEHYYSQFTFKPEVSKGTQEMAAKTPLNELVDNERRKLVMEAAQRAVEEAERSECTFKPKINRRKIPNRPHQINVKDPAAISRHIDEYKKEREQRMAAQRAAKQHEEQQQCTFSPAINPDTPRRDDTPVVVRGLGRHLELQELAKRNRIEQEEREAKIFIINPKDITQKPQYTIPEPFNLHHQDRDLRYESLKRQVEGQVMQQRAAECTFAPKTLHKQHKQMIESILRQPDDEADFY